MKTVLRVIAGWLALGVLVQGRVLVLDLADWPGFTRWAGPLAAWFVASEVIHVVGGLVGAIQLWRLTQIGRIAAIVVTVFDGLHNLVPWLLGPTLGVNRFSLRGGDVFGIVMSVAVLVVLLHPEASRLCRGGAVPNTSVSVV